MASDQTPFGLWLRQHRKVLDLTQKELAKHIGCSESAFRKFESGARRPSRQIIERLADYFGLSPNERASLVRLARAEPHTETAQQAHDQAYPDAPVS
jgi:transcriptional regulator with XRE-family HTH domain